MLSDSESEDNPISLFCVKCLHDLFFYRFFQQFNQIYYFFNQLIEYVSQSPLSSSNYTYFFISNQGQALALRVACIFMAFGAQSCLMFAKQFSNVQDSKPIFMISYFKTFPKMLLRQLTAILRLLQRKNSTFI